MIKTKMLFLLGIALALVSMGSSASLIQYSTRTTTNGVDQTDYKQSWSNQVSAPTTSFPGEFTNVTAPGDNHHSYLKVIFTAGTDFAGNDWAFQVAPDAGFGGALYMDGVQVDIDSSDLWWGQNWNNLSHILAATSLSVGAGDHTFEAYWAEGCCNGPQSARFSTNGGQDWMNLSTKNLDSVSTSSVPEPGVLALMGLGLLGFAGSRKMKGSRQA